MTNPISLTVSRETESLLHLYIDELRKWQKIKNLVSPHTLDSAWERHIVDSLQLLALAPDAKHWLDIGSGAGFPGLVLAIALKNVPQAHVDLVESNVRKSSFLKHIIRKTGALASVHVMRIEDFATLKTVQSPSYKPDMITARALAPLTRLLSFTQTFLRQGSCGLFMKGKDVQSELTKARECWTFDYDLVPSVTDSEARIVRVSSLA
jgi:16S rRNA (guanine527-N7)-methyltransferase